MKQRYEHTQIWIGSTQSDRDKVLKEMEKDGWELCAVVSYYYLIFKRPI